MPNFSTSNCKCIRATLKMMPSDKLLIRKKCCEQFKFSPTDPSWFKIGGSNQWYLTALHKFPNLGSKSTGISFFISYLVVPRLTLDHLQGSSLTILMLITLYIYLLNPKVARNLVLRFSPKPQLSTSVKFNSFQK